MQIYYLKGTCTRTSCEYWHPPECEFYKNETGSEAGDKCLFPHYKVDEQAHEILKKSHIPKRRERDDKNAVAVVKSVSQLGCVSRDSDALVSGNPDAESLGADSKGMIHQVHATSGEYPGKERTIDGKKKCQSSSSAKSQRCETRRQVP